MAQWYAQYRTSDKVVVGGGFFVDPSFMDDAEHDVSVAFDGQMPELTTVELGDPPVITYLKKYNTTSEELEDNV